MQELYIALLKCIPKLSSDKTIAESIRYMSPNSAGTWNFRISGIEKNRKMWWIMI